ncbi:hypothetical protein RF11_05142 [Thelohanellus kitauei]|uniref:Uncharacterized protein n=1 Tax=Thelohanellus kitauei TaxID=669202 RepID=A0A0C2MIH4_THEKT|nr:hypothetical protein RF11_05142 [Thelohanellus kitauei]
MLKIESFCKIIVNKKLMRIGKQSQQLFPQSFSERLYLAALNSFFRLSTPWAVEDKGEISKRLVVDESYSKFLPDITLRHRHDLRLVKGASKTTIKLPYI